MIQGKLIEYGDDLTPIKKLREKSKYILSDLEKEEIAVYALVYDCENEQRPVATGRLALNNNEFYIDNLFVLEDERRKKYGDFVVRLLVNRGFLSGANEIKVWVDDNNLVPFFEKIGFKKVTNYDKIIIIIFY